MRIAAFSLENYHGLYDLMYSLEIRYKTLKSKMNINNALVKREIGTIHSDFSEFIIKENESLFGKFLNGCKSIITTLRDAEYQLSCIFETKDKYAIPTILELSHDTKKIKKVSKNFMVGLIDRYL